LFYVNSGDRLLIWDSRPASRDPLLILTDLSKQVYLSCDQVATPRRVLETCRSNHFSNADLQSVTEVLEKLREKAILVEEDGAYLALAINGAGGAAT
jgi:hypothetical protein